MTPAEVQRAQEEFLHMMTKGELSEALLAMAHAGNTLMVCFIVICGAVCATYLFLAIELRLFRTALKQHLN
jgi:hypothetical protein